MGDWEIHSSYESPTEAVNLWRSWHPCQDDYLATDIVSFEHSITVEMSPHPIHFHGDSLPRTLIPGAEGSNYEFRVVLAAVCVEITFFFAMCFQTFSTWGPFFANKKVGGRLQRDRTRDWGPAKNPPVLIGNVVLLAVYDWARYPQPNLVMRAK